MASSVSTIDHSPAVAGAAGTSEAEPAAQDGWRGGGLPALRAELDRIDDAVHDLLMQRAEVVERVARSGKPAAFRPGREASILRRLVSRHQGALPPVAVVRIWRELLAGTTAMQGGFSVVVGDPQQQAAMTQLAREHFGALTPLRRDTDAGSALADVGQGVASVAVLPYPSADSDWWLALLRYQPRLHIVARLPFWQARPNGFSAAQGLVVAATAPDASEQDRSFLGLECDSDVSRSQLAGELSTAGLRPDNILLARQTGSLTTVVLAEIEGYLSDDDSRLDQVGSHRRRPVVLGGYAVPIGGEAA